MYPRNASSPERIAVGPVVQISDGAVQTSGCSIKVKPQGGSASAGEGSTTYEEGIVAYVPTQAETNYTSFQLIAYKTGCIPAAITVVTTASATPGTVIPAADSITASVFDESTAFPLKSADTGSTAVARVGADGDTLETLSDQLDGIDGAVGNIANVGAPSYEAPSSYTLTTGTQTAGTIADVDTDNQIDYHVHTDSAGVLSLIYDWEMDSDQQANSITWNGRWNGTNDTLLFELYDWVGAGWVTWFTRAGVAGTTSAADFTQEAKLVQKYTGVGSNAGKVRCRITGSGLTSCTLSTDYLMVGKTTAAGGISNGSTITLTSAAVNKNFIGSNWVLDLNGQEISGSYFKGAKQVTGVASGSTEVCFEDCDFGAATVPPGKYQNCGFGLSSGTLTAASAGQYVLRSCYSRVPGSGTPSFDWATATGTVGVNGREWHGGSSHTIDGDTMVSWEVVGGGGQTFAGGGTVELRGIMRAATLTGCAAGKTSQIVGVIGPVSVNGSGGTVNIYGTVGTVTNNSGGAVTIVDSQAVTNDNISQATLALLEPVMIIP